MALPAAEFRSPGEGLAWLGGLVLALSSFMSWYTFDADVGFTVSITGWHTGLLGKLVFFVGLAVLAFLALRARPWIDVQIGAAQCHQRRHRRAHVGDRRAVELQVDFFFVLVLLPEQAAAATRRHGDGARNCDDHRNAARGPKRHESE